MDAPLWTETHAPSLSDLPQSEVRDRLQGAIEEPMNLWSTGRREAGRRPLSGLCQYRESRRVRRDSRRAVE